MGALPLLPSAPARPRGKGGLGRVCGLCFQFGSQRAMGFGAYAEISKAPKLGGIGQ